MAMEGGDLHGSEVKDVVEWRSRRSGRDDGTMVPTLRNRNLMAPFMIQDLRLEIFIVIFSRILCNYAEKKSRVQHFF